MIDRKWLGKSGQLKRTGVPQYVRNAYYIEKARKRHGDTYLYTELDVGQTTRDLVTIICRVHGQFRQQLNQHLQGCGCEACYIDRITLTRTKPNEEFILEAAKVHNNKYVYYDLAQTNNKQKIPILCPKHGVFYQQRKTHLKGSGCPQCATQCSNLYILYDPWTCFTKIGISSNTNRRIKELKLPGLLCVLDKQLKNAYYVEQQLHKKYEKQRVRHPTASTGCTEFFNLNLIELEELKAYVESL